MIAKSIATTVVIVTLGLAASLPARAEFVPPTESKIAAAASNPASEMGALLEGAGTEQAANVVKAVIAKALALGLSSDVQAARIAAVIASAFAAIPAQHQIAFAASLGTAVACSPAIVSAPGTVSQIQSAVATAGGAQNGSALAQSFGDAYAAAIQSNGGAGEQQETDAPPVSTVYPGQDR